MTARHLPEKIEKRDDLLTLSADKEHEAFVDAVVSYVVGIVEKFIPGLGFLTIWRQKRQNKKEEEVLKSLKKEISAQTQNVANISNMLKNPKAL